MKRLFFLFVIIVSLLAPAPSFVWGQTTPSLVWEKNMGNNNVQFCLTITKDNNFVINTQPTASNTDLIMNFDAQGDVLWQIQKINIPRTTIEYGQNLLTTIYNNGNNTMMVLDYSGNIVQTIPMPEVVASHIYILYIYPDKNTGKYYMLGVNNSQTAWMIFVYDSQLNFIRSFPVENTQMSWTQGMTMLDGNIYIPSVSYGVGIYTNLVANIYKYDSTGNLIWDKPIPDYDYPYISNDNGKLYLGGTKFSSSSQYFQINKLDTTGNILWTKDGPGVSDSNRANFVKGILPLPGGGCLVYGIVSYLGNVERYHPVAIALSAQGDSLFSISPSTNSLGEFDVAAWDNNNALILAGSVDGVSKIWKYSIPGITAVKKENSGVPTEFSLSQNYPNPFNPTTTINFSLAKSSFVSLKIYDLLGREVKNLVNDELKSGNYNVKFDGGNLPSGVYVYTLQTQNFVSTKKMVLLK